MARTDLSRSNHWIPEPTDSQVIAKVLQTSAVESLARKVNMTSDALRVPRFAQDGVDIVAEGALIPQKDATLDSVLLEANKWANRFTLSVEDERDAIVDAFNQFKLHWADAFAKELDNACLGVTADSTGPGTSVPFQSVYNAADSASQVVQIGAAGAPVALKYEDLNDVFGTLESGDYSGNLVVVAHPSLKSQLRNLKDANGDRVVSVDAALGAGVPQIFGHDLVFSNGARTSATATDKPSGNALLVVGSRDHMILGVRDGIESAIADNRWEYDEREVKMRARRAFAVATPEAFVVIEKVV